MGIRSTAKGVIIDHGRVLLNKCKDAQNGEYYSLPGGGQNQYETLREAVIRECLEETGYTVAPVRFAALYEEICMDESFRRTHPGYAHKMYHIFICELAAEEMKAPSETDSAQLGSEWVELEALRGLRLLPQLVGNHILEIIGGGAPVFLGSGRVEWNHG